MQNLAKTLILNSNRDNNFKAILNLKSQSNSEIKFYNLKEINKTLALGIKQNSRVIKIPLSVKGDKCDFSVENKINFEQGLICAVVDISNPFCPEIILSGSQNSKQENNKIESAFTISKPEDSSVLYEKDSQEDIENLIDSNLEDDMKSTYYDSCAKCKYREAFYNEGKSCSDKLAQIASNDKNKDLETNKELNDEKEKYENKKEENTNTGDEKNEEDNNIEDKNQEVSFYEQIKPQIDALFAKYEKYELLEEIIPNSKWTKIIYDNDGNFYVLGLIFNEQANVLYICYGMPSRDRNVPPEELKEYAGWLPIDSNNPSGEGYFIVCQDAESGKTLKVDLI